MICECLGIYYSEFHVPLKAEFGDENYATSDFTMFQVLEKQRWASLY